VKTAGRPSRREFLIGGTLAAAIGVAGCGSARSSTARPPSSPDGTPPGTASPGRDSSADRPSRVAYLMLFDKGVWNGPRNADGSPSLSVIDDLVAPRSGQAVPRYVRLGNSGDEAGAAGSLSAEELSVMTQLKKAGIKLGTAINTLAPAKQKTGTSGAQPPAAEDLINLGHQIRQVSAAHGGLYDWIFLDHASELTPAGGRDVNDLQQVVDGLSEAGWSRVMINATTFNENHFADLPQRTWAMARAFGVMSRDYQTEGPKAVASASVSAAVTSGDEAFVNYVHTNRPGSAALLKLEVPGQIQRFRQLSVSDQTTLLRMWAQAGAGKDFRIIYPLYTSDYDSAAIGTLAEQRQLMQRYG
jgi:hypothetical protein